VRTFVLNSDREREWHFLYVVVGLVNFREVSQGLNDSRFSRDLTTWPARDQVTRHHVTLDCAYISLDISQPRCNMKSPYQLFLTMQHKCLFVCGVCWSCFLGRTISRSGDVCDVITIMHVDVVTSLITWWRHVTLNTWCYLVCETFCMCMYRSLDFNELRGII